MLFSMWSSFSAFIGHTYVGLTIERHAIFFLEITFLKLFTITVEFAIWARNFSGKEVIIYTDNEALVLNFNAFKSKRVMNLLRRLVLQGVMPNIQFKAKRTVRVYNVKGDSFFRQQWNQFRASFPDATTSYQQFPHCFCT